MFTKGPGPGPPAGPLGSEAVHGGLVAASISLFIDFAIPQTLLALRRNI